MLSIIICKDKKAGFIMKEIMKVDNCSDDILQLIQNSYKTIIESTQKVITTVNATLLDSYWNIGKLIVEQEQNGNNKSQYASDDCRKI